MTLYVKSWPNIETKNAAAHKNNYAISSVCYLKFTVCKCLSKLCPQNVAYQPISDA